MSKSNLEKNRLNPGTEGFSLIELLIVMAIMLILTGTSFYYLAATQDLYKADEQALKISDVLQEARQRSLTQRRTMRVEIDMTDNMIRLIDEDDPTTVNDDTMIRSFPLLAPEEVRVDERPGQIPDNPPEEFPVPNAQFRQSIYPESLAHDVATLRFQSNGTVVDQGTNEIGQNAVSTGATLHIWSPLKGDVNNSKIARSITIIGSTGSIRLWEYDPRLEGSVKWKDTRRTSIFGGQQAGGNSATGS